MEMIFKFSVHNIYCDLPFGFFSFHRLAGLLKGGRMPVLTALIGFNVCPYIKTTPI